MTGSYRCWFVKKYYWLVYVREKYYSDCKFTIVYDEPQADANRLMIVRHRLQLHRSIDPSMCVREYVWIGKSRSISFFNFFCSWSALSSWPWTMVGVGMCTAAEAGRMARLTSLRGGPANHVASNGPCSSWSSRPAALCCHATAS